MDWLIEKGRPQTGHFNSVLSRMWLYQKQTRLKETQTIIFDIILYLQWNEKQPMFEKVLFLLYISHCSYIYNMFHVKHWKEVKIRTSILIR